VRHRGEPVLAPAIFGAVDDAVGVRPSRAPSFTPDRLRAALLARGGAP
jgi:hypothetical protein